MATKKRKTRQTEHRKGGGIYERVTDALIGLIEGGNLPWRTRWSSVHPRRQQAKKPLLVPDRRLLLPLSLSSGKPYQGVNILALPPAATKKELSEELVVGNWVRAQLRLDRRVSPPAFTLAPPRLK